MGKKGMEEREHTILGLHIPTPVTLPSSAGNYLQVPCTCFALRAASHLASRVNVAEVLIMMLAAISSNSLTSTGQ
jgi:hypothetical protein